MQTPKDKLIHMPLMFIGLSTVALSIFILTAGGSLLSRYRYDEIWFLHNSWAAYHEQIGLFYTPPTLGYLLKQFWSLTGGDISKLWQLRIVAFVFVLAQAASVFYLTAHIKIKNQFIQLLIPIVATLVFLTLSVNFRGFEIRPEIIPNTIILLSAVAIFRLSSPSCSVASSRSIFVIISFLLLISSSISIRHILPNLCLATLVLIAASEGNKLNANKSWKIFFSIAIVLFFAALLALLIHNEQLLNGVRQTIKFQFERTPRNWIDKLIIGGTASQLFAKCTIISTCVLLLAFYRSRYHVGLGLLFSLILFYLFLFILDVRPFEYIRSIEWTLLIILSAFAFSEATKNTIQNHYMISRIDRIILFMAFVTVFTILYYTFVASAAALSLNSAKEGLNKIHVILIICIISSIFLAVAIAYTPKSYVVPLFTHSKIIGFLACLTIIPLVNYINHIQFILIIILAALFSSILPNRVNLKYIRICAFLTVTVSFSWTYYESVGKLWANENTIKTIRAVISTRTTSDLRTMPPKEFGDVLINSISIFDQIRSRQLYCSWYPTGRAIVYIWAHHPICLQDSDSYSLSLLEADKSSDGLNYDLSKHDFISLPYFKPTWVMDVPKTHTKIGDSVWLNHPKSE